MYYTPKKKKEVKVSALQFSLFSLCKAKSVSSHGKHPAIKHRNHHYHIVQLWHHFPSCRAPRLEPSFGIQGNPRVSCNRLRLESLSPLQETKGLASSVFCGAYSSGTVTTHRTTGIQSDLSSSSRTRPLRIRDSPDFGLEVLS